MVTCNDGSGFKELDLTLAITGADNPFERRCIGSNKMLESPRVALKVLSWDHTSSSKARFLIQSLVDE
jgi:hypothetical protein